MNPRHHAVKRSARAFLLGTCLTALLFSVQGRGWTAERPKGVLASYSFEGEAVETGPDTLAVFRHHKGRVYLSSDFYVSGYNSVAIEDAPGDCAFPELQGYFPLQATGRLYAHFSILVTNPDQVFNVALAGTRWFHEVKDGISFWLENRDGILYHHTARELEELYALTPFVWYSVDLAYDIDRGTYNLVIHEESNPNPIVDLRDRQNAPGAERSSLDKFSFVGDVFGDRSAALYYVDDIVIGTDHEISQVDFTAPARKKLFTEHWMEYQKKSRNKIRCVKPMAYSDLGVPDEVLRDLIRAGHMHKIRDAMDSRKSTRKRALADTDHLDPMLVNHLESLARWTEGCELLKSGKSRSALRTFKKARWKAQGEARGLDLSIALAHAALGDWQEADELLARGAELWRDDIRFAIATAMTGIAKDRRKQMEKALKEMEHWLPSDLEDPQHMILAKQGYYILVWTERTREAADFATRLAESRQRANLPSGEWWGLVGDASFFAGDYHEALYWYDKALSKPDAPTVFLYRRLADVHFKLGDLETERYYRGKLYGTLTRERTEEDKPLGAVAPPCKSR